MVCFHDAKSFATADVFSVPVCSVTWGKAFSKLLRSASKQRFVLKYSIKKKMENKKKKSKLYPQSHSLILYMYVCFNSKP